MTSEDNAAARELLMGRIVGGMLHDLAQPLNVVSMASSNLAHMIERLEIDEDSRRKLLERTRRISDQSDIAADIVALFRSLGRAARPGDLPEREGPAVTIGDALKRAIAVARSSLPQQFGIALSGRALALRIPGREGSLEILGLAALLSAFGAFTDPPRRPQGGSVQLRADKEGDLLVVTADCIDEGGEGLDCMPLDAATFQLLADVARRAGGDFCCLPSHQRPSRIVLSLAFDPV